MLCLLSYSKLCICDMFQERGKKHKISSSRSYSSTTNWLRGCIFLSLFLSLLIEEETLSYWPILMLIGFSAGGTFFCFLPFFPDFESQSSLSCEIIGLKSELCNFTLSLSSFLQYFFLRACLLWSTVNSYSRYFSPRLKETLQHFLSIQCPFAVFYNIFPLNY